LNLLCSLTLTGLSKLCSNDKIQYSFFGIQIDFGCEGKMRIKVASLTRGNVRIGCNHSLYNSWENSVFVVPECISYQF